MGINELFTAAAPGIKCLCVFTVHANGIANNMYEHSRLHIRNDLLKCVSLSAGKCNVQDSGVCALFYRRNNGAWPFKVAAVTTACTTMYLILGHPGYFWYICGCACKFWSHDTKPQHSPKCRVVWCVDTAQTSFCCNKTLRHDTPRGCWGVGIYIYRYRLAQYMTITRLNHFFSLTLSSYWNINSRKFNKNIQSSMMGNMIKQCSKMQKYLMITIDISTELKNSILVRF